MLWICRAAVCCNISSYYVQHNGAERSDVTHIEVVLYIRQQSIYTCAFSTAGVDFLRANPAPFKLPGSQLFKIPLDYVPNEAAVKRCKYWTGWKVHRQQQGSQIFESSLSQHHSAG
jgi:hypothetical protein